MDDSQAGSDNESACGQTPYDGADIDLSNLWLDQTDPGDSRYLDSSQLNGGEPASNDQYTQNDGSSDPNIAVHDGISLGSPNNFSWHALRPDLALNSILIDPNLYDQVDYATAAPPFTIPEATYNSSHDAPMDMEVDPFVPLNYQRQSEYQHHYLYPSVSSGPSVQSAPSDILSAISLPFSSPFAGTNNSTTQTSHFDSGIPRLPGPFTERSSGSSTEKPFNCDRCTRRFRTRKDLDRHKHTHDPRWPEGQRVEGLFHCRCGKRDPRKDNYRRHHRSCNPSNYTHETFICKCSFENSDQVEHLNHIEACKHCKKRRGRPPGSRSRAASCTAE